jgi:hypothetical protein
MNAMLATGARVQKPGCKLSGEIWGLEALAMGYFFDIQLLKLGCRSSRAGALPTTHAAILHLCIFCSSPSFCLQSAGHDAEAC